MPYIDEKSRSRAKQTPATPGELNYAITKIIDDYLSRIGVSYSTLNTCVGVLECAKLELYRRVVIPYENKKLDENGDVYFVVSGPTE